MQTIFKIEDGESQKLKELERLLQADWKIVMTTKIDYGRTTLFILEKKDY